MKQIIAVIVYVAFLGISNHTFSQTAYLTPYQKLSKFSQGKVQQLTISTDNKFIAAADVSGKAAVWEIEGNRLLKQWDAGKLQFFKHTPAGDLILVNAKGEIKVLSSNSYTEKNTSAFSSVPQMVSLDPTGQNLLALEKDGIEIFDLRAFMMQTKILFTTDIKDAKFIGFDRFGQQLSLITELGQVLTWNPINQRLVRELKLQSGEYSGSRSVIHDVSNNFGGDRFVVGLQEVFRPKGGAQASTLLERKNLIVFYDWATGQELKRIPVRYRVDQMAQGPGASNLAYFSTDALSIFLVNYEGGTITSTVKVKELPHRITFSDNGELFAVGNIKGEVDLYYVERNTPAEIKIQMPAIDRSYASEPTGETNLRVKGIIEGTERVSKILINGTPAQNDFSGGFEGEISLEPGKNKVRVVAETSEQKQIVKDFYVTMEPSKATAKNLMKHTGNGKRVALIIGNANYQYSNKLNNTINDAKTMEQTLKELGFQVTLITDGSYENMKNAVYAFGDQISDVDISLFYYAGHGLEVDGTNYLVPVDANIQSALDVKQKALPLTGILRTMEFTNEEGLNMIILDACRNNPFPTGKRGGTGLAKVNAPSGTLIAYATDPGSTASDGTGTNGLYTGVLSQQLKISQRIEDIFMNTRNKVEELSKGSQRPWEELRLKGVFYLK